MIYVLIGAVCISFSSVFVKWADVDPTAVSFYRFLFGFLALGIAACLKREQVWRGPYPLVWALVGGALFSFDLFFWHRSIHFVGPGLATILANFQVFGLAVIGVMVMGERFSWNLAVAAPLSIAGLLILIGLDWQGLDTKYRLGIVYGLITAAVYTFLTLSLRKGQTIPNGLSPLSATVWVCLVGALAAAVEVEISGERFTVPDAHSWIALIGYGGLCQGLGWSLISRGLPRIDASLAGLLLILQPTLAFVWDVLLFARPTTWLNGLGALIALVAIYMGSMKRDGD